MDEKITDSGEAIQNLLDLANSIKEDDWSMDTQDLVDTIRGNTEAIENRITKLKAEVERLTAERNALIPAWHEKSEREKIQKQCEIEINAVLFAVSCVLKDEADVDGETRNAVDGAKKNFKAIVKMLNDAYILHNRSMSPTVAGLLSKLLTEEQCPLVSLTDEYVEDIIDKAITDLTDKEASDAD